MRSTDSMALGYQLRRLSRQYNTQTLVEAALQARVLRPHQEVVILAENEVIASAIRQRVFESAPAHLRSLRKARHRKHEIEGIHVQGYQSPMLAISGTLLIDHSLLERLLDNRGQSGIDLLAAADTLELIDSGFLAIAGIVGVAINETFTPFMRVVRVWQDAAKEVDAIWDVIPSSLVDPVAHRHISQAIAKIYMGFKP